MKRAPFFYNFETEKPGLMFSDILTAIEQKQPLAFSRWGDGEWACIFQDRGANVDNCKYIPEMGLELSRILQSNPEYYLGIQDFAIYLMNNRIENYLQRMGVAVAFHDADIIHKASYRGELYRLFEVLYDRQAVLIAPDYMSTMSDFFEFTHVIIPEKDCYHQNSAIIEAILEQKQADVYLYCSGMAANIQIDRCFKALPEAIHLDIGAVFDPFCGKNTRVYHSKVDILQKNGYV